MCRKSKHKNLTIIFKLTNVNDKIVLFIYNFIGVDVINGRL